MPELLQSSHPAYPTGTVTFLFTDIEGSTQLWEQHPGVMGQSLARHDSLVRHAIEKHNGAVFKTVGDAFCAAFPTALDALSAAVAAQKALLAAVWEETGLLRVRMALHTGLAQERDNDYFGPTLNRTARLLSLGHGGQILLSLPTYELVRDHLEPNITLQDLGSYRLKDLLRAEQVFQVVHPDLPEGFPRLNSLEAQPNNLPQQLSSFIGREREMAEVKERLRSTRMLTLTGSGGAGKTRLSLQVAADLLDEFSDGVWFIELAPLAQPDLVAQAFASLLQVKEESGRTRLESLANAIKARKMLLVLDNCEHLIAACAQMAEDLLRACPHLHILASSREALRLPGEVTYLVPSLSLPDPNQLPSPETLNQYEAVRLFIDRAVASRPSFTVNNQNAPAVAQICARLDGIPLALELAAARIRVLQPEQIAARLDDRFKLLTGGSRTALPRQQTLRALIDWSYDLLSEPEKSLWNRLSIFSGGWTLEAAETVCADTGDVLDLLAALVDKSIVFLEEREGMTRYRMLETLRQYGLDRLRERGEIAALHDSHLDFYGHFAAEAEPKLMGSEQQVWLKRLDAENDNLRAALDWCQSGLGDRDMGLRLARDLWRFWIIRGYYREGRARLAELLKEDGKGSPSLRGKALNTAGNLAYMQSDYEEARHLYEQSLELLRPLGDKQGMASLLNNLGLIAWNQSRFEEARSLIEQGMNLRQELGDRHGLATALNSLGNLARSQGRLEEARPLFEQALTIYREVDDQLGVAVVLYNLSAVTLDQGDIEAARAFAEDSLTVRQALGDRQGIAASLHVLGDITQRQGDLEAARALFEQSLSIKREVGDVQGIGASLFGLGNLELDCGNLKKSASLLRDSLQILSELQDQRLSLQVLEALAIVLSRDRQAEKATQLYAAAENIRNMLGIAHTTSTQAESNRTKTELRDALGDTDFELEWQAGTSLSSSQVVAEILKEINS